MEYDLEYEYKCTWQKWEMLRDEHVSLGKTVGGWSYGDFVTPYVEYIHKDSDISKYQPGPKMINTLVGLTSSEKYQNTWYDPWRQASDPITPYVTWDDPRDFRHNNMTINGGHRGALSKQFFEPRPLQYWDEGFALLQGTRVDDGSTLPLGGHLWLHTQAYRLKATYALCLWPYTYGNNIRDAFSFCPGYPRVSYVLEFNSGHDVINILDKGLNVIWSNTSLKVQAWLKLLSEPAKVPTWKKYLRDIVWRHLTPSRWRVNLSYKRYYAPWGPFEKFLNAPPAVEKRASGFSPAIWQSLLVI